MQVLALACAWLLAQFSLGGAAQVLRRNPSNGIAALSAIYPSEQARHVLFETRREAVDAHNRKGTSSWTAALNEFANRTDHERRAFLGYNRAPRAGVRSRGASFLEVHPALSVAVEVDHRKQLQSASYVANQGQCGSCWAVAAVGAMEMRLELAHGRTTKLSWQQLVDCVPNPKHCGGSGGCSGATSELAFEYVQQHGLAAAANYSESTSAPSHRNCLADVPHSVKVESFVQLPPNQASPMIAALLDGPIVVAVSADGWFPYGHGIYDECPQDVVLNHAVLLAGYGSEDSFGGFAHKYWLIRNSWGSSWGEKGFIRIFRHTDDNAYCGIDKDPQQGVACQNGPKEMTVCGMCGILADASYPVGTHFSAAAHRK